MADTDKIERICSSTCYYVELGPGKQHLVQPVKLPDQPLNPVSHDRVADLLADGYPDPGGTPKAFTP